MPGAVGPPSREAVGERFVHDIPTVNPALEMVKKSNDVITQTSQHFGFGGGTGTAVAACKHPVRHLLVPYQGVAAYSHSMLAGERHDLVRP